VFRVSSLEDAGIYGKGIDMIIRDEHLNGEAELAHIVSALSLLDPLLCRNNPGKNEGSQHGDHGDDHQQFNQGETSASER
jgi:hypothetical protein